jgi:hypothetical protein
MGKTMRERSAMDEINEDLGITVVVKRPRWKVIAGFLAALAGAALAVWLRLILFGVLMVVVVLVAIARAQSPEFAIDDSGLRLPVARRPLKSSFWRLRDLGLYLWDEVRYCHWSHHESGVLNVQVNSTRSLDEVIEEPPTRLFYRVPDRHRADVEKALRARGKWAE